MNSLIDMFIEKLHNLYPTLPIYDSEDAEIIGECLLVLAKDLRSETAVKNFARRTCKLDIVYMDNVRDLKIINDRILELNDNFKDNISTEGFHCRVISSNTNIVKTDIICSLNLEWFEETRKKDDNEDNYELMQNVNVNY